MTKNMNTNATENKKKKNPDPANTTAYGDPVKASLPTINNEFKKANFAIAESTQNGNNHEEYKDY